MQRAPSSSIGYLLRAIAMLVGLSATGFASGYFTTVDDAWQQASVVVVGVPVLVTERKELYRTRRAAYAVDVIHAYKGSTDGARVEFINQSWGTTGDMIRAPGAQCILFLLTEEDRKKSHREPAERAEVLTGLIAFPVKAAELPEMNAALETVKAYSSLPEAERDDFALQHLSWKNRYIPNFFTWEAALHRRIKAAAPHFRERLWQARDEEERKLALTYLRILVGPDTKPTLLAWLNDPAFPKRADVIREMAAYKDPAYLPAIRARVDAADESLACEACRALYELGEPDGSVLLFDVIAKSHDPNIRLRALLPLEKARAEEFSDAEKARIRELTKDQDDQVARIARLISYDWP